MAMLPASAARGLSFTQALTIDSFARVQFPPSLPLPSQIQSIITKCLTVEINSINKSINTCYTSIHSTPFSFLPLTKNSRTAPPSSPMLTSRNATQRKEFVDSSMSKQVRREDLLTRLCKGTRSRIETKLLPRRIFGEGTTSRFEIDSISRLKRWRYFDDRISHLVTRSSRAKREFDIYRNRFRDLKLIVQVMATRVINYQSIIHRVLTVNYDPKE